MDGCNHPNAEEFLSVEEYIQMKVSVPGLSGRANLAVVAGLLFFIISHPMMYNLVQSLLGPLVGRIAGPGGCPTTLGLLVHAVVFGVAAMYLL